MFLVALIITMLFFANFYLWAEKIRLECLIEDINKDIHQIMKVLDNDN